MQYKFSTRKYDKKWKLVLSYKLPDGTWKQKTKSGYSGKAIASAESEKKKLLKSINIRPLADSSMSNITLKNFSDIVFDDLKGTLSNNSIIAYKIALKGLTSLYEMKIVDIKQSDCIHAINSMDRSPATINIALISLKKVLNHAVNTYSIISENPALSIHSVRKIEEEKRKALTKEQFDGLMEYLKPYPKVYAICAVAGYAGLRIGEIFGLQWGDVDLINGTISVKRQWARINGSKMGYKSLKTQNSYRTIPIPPVLISILIKYKKSTNIFDINGKIFSMGHRQRITNKTKKFLSGTTIHSLRHTYATRLLGDGLNVKTVAALLGDTVNTVINVYVHYNDDLRDEAAKFIKEAF